MKRKKGYKRKNLPAWKTRKVRNPSRTTIKKLARPANGLAPGWAARHVNYFLFNRIGTALYDISKGRICNRQAIGLSRYWSKADREKVREYEALVKTKIPK